MQESPFKRHQPLYLKYRPQSLAQLVGQEGVNRTLVNAIQNNRLSHAYLFTGPRGTGKTSSARILAKSLNCKAAGQPTVEPCQTCSCCQEITKGNSPAVFEIDAASNNSVDDARVLIERAPLVAVGGEYKVYIIDECHMLSKEAFNALLKTIEQPPPKVVFILATTEEHKVLPTIVSRCQRLMFKLINQDELGRHLRYVADSEKIEIEDEALQLIARRSGGGLRDALSNLDQASLLAAPGAPARVGDLLRLLGALHEDILLEMSRHIAERAGQSVISAVNQFLAEGREPQVVLQELSRHFLNLMKASYLTGSAPVENSMLKNIVLGSESYLSGLAAQATLFERAELSQIIEQLDRLEQTCRYSSQPAMHLEIGLLGICHRHDIHLLKDLLLRIEHLEAQAVSPQREIQPQAPRTQAPLRAPARPAMPEPEAKPAKQAQSISRPEPEANPADELSGRPDTPPFAAAPQAAPPDSDAEEPEAAAESAAAAEIVSERAGASGDSRIDELNSDIEYFWQQVLDELQRRHIPTFSLASTHAFPLHIANGEVTIGVMKDTFQKMLVSKTDHIRVACKAVSGLDLDVRIRVTEPSAPAQSTPVPKPAAAGRPAPAEKDKTGASESRPVQASTSRSADTGAASVQNQSQPVSDSPAEKTTANQETELDSSLVKEAYKLFEGPGSRRIN